MSEKLKLWLVVGLIIVAIVVAFAVYIPWQTNRMNRDSVRDVAERSPQNLEKLYDQWQDLVLRYGQGDQSVIREADKLAADIADLYGDNSILIPTNDGHLWIDGSKI